MAVISKLKKQKTSNRVNVFLNNKFSFSLTPDEVYRHHLSVGQKLTKEQIKNLSLKSFQEKLFFKVLNFLSYRPRSEKEIKDYLTKNLAKDKNLDLQLKKEIKTQTIDRLKKDKLINDYEFCQWWLEQRSAFKPKGKRGLSLELRQKGINPKIIAQALAKISEKQLLASAQKIITPKLKLYKNLPKIKLKQKLIGFLSRRGFSWEIIKSVVDEAMLKL